MGHRVVTTDRSTKWVVACAVLMLVAIAGVILTVHFHTELSDPPSAFAVVVDAGSTHTDVCTHTHTYTHTHMQ